MTWHPTMKEMEGIAESFVCSGDPAVFELWDDDNDRVNDDRIQDLARRLMEAVTEEAQDWAREERSRSGVTA